MPRQFRFLQWFGLRPVKLFRPHWGAAVEQLNAWRLRRLMWDPVL